MEFYYSRKLSSFIEFTSFVKIS